MTRRDEYGEPIVVGLRKPRIYRCRDRMCGGDDCATCYPEIAFRREDDEDDETED